MPPEGGIASGPRSRARREARRGGSPGGHLTVISRVAVPDLDPFVHVTVTGHLPGVVVLPTSHVQVILPFAGAVFFSSPFARE